jgi:hypothetical protein
MKIILIKEVWVRKKKLEIKHNHKKNNRSIQMKLKEYKLLDFYFDPT